MGHSRKSDDELIPSDNAYYGTILRYIGYWVGRMQHDKRWYFQRPNESFAKLQGPYINRETALQAARDDYSKRKWPT